MSSGRRPPAGTPRTRGIPTPILGGIIFTVVSTMLGVVTRDQELGGALVSGISGGIVFTLAWFLIIRVSRRQR